MSTLKEDITTTIKNNHGILFAAPQLVGRHTVSLIYSNPQNNLQIKHSHVLTTFPSLIQPSL